LRFGPRRRCSGCSKARPRPTSTTPSSSEKPTESSRHKSSL
jgi:hypothetical protein